MHPPTKTLILIITISITLTAWLNIQLNPTEERAQLANLPQHYCLTNELLALDQSVRPKIKNTIQQFDNQIFNYLKKTTKSNANPPYVIPAAVHIIHQNGSENLSDAAVNMAIQRLNQLLANAPEFDATTGAATDISLCLAQRTPTNQPTNGIERIDSELTNLVAERQDVDLKNLTQWSPRNYLNIYVVNAISSTAIGDGIVGYAYLPAFHGTTKDGIVIEAGQLTNENGIATLAHELGHYLGLYHTFEGGCTNENCATQGDRVCDTPPDNTTVATACDVSVNSCFSDTESGWATDENDSSNNYMDYIRLECYSAFTAGQVERMHATLETRRQSLLTSPACQPPCLNPIRADFTTNDSEVIVNQEVIFNNESQNTTDFIWKVNGEAVSTATNLNYTFTETGDYLIHLLALGTENCPTDSTELSLRVDCPLQAVMTTEVSNLAVGNTMTLRDESVGAERREWIYNEEVISTESTLTFTRAAADPLKITLVATLGNCRDTAVLNEIFYTETNCANDFVRGNEMDVLINNNLFETLAITNNPTRQFIITNQNDVVSLHHRSHEREFLNIIRNNRLFYPPTQSIFDFRNRNECGEICDNEIDDDGDGLIDCFDPDCCGRSVCDDFYYPICEPPECTFSTDQPLRISRLEVVQQLPAAAPHTMPVIGDMNGDGLPEIVAKAAPLLGSDTNQPLTKDLVIYNINGNAASFITIQTPEIDVVSTPVIIDADRDGQAEIYLMAADSERNANYQTATNGGQNVQRKLFCYEWNGNNYQEKWVSTAKVLGVRPYSLSAADLNSDGNVELLIGEQIFRANDGLYLARTPSGFLPTAQTLIAVDALPDDYCEDCAGLELIGNGRAYSVTIDPANPTESYIKLENKSGLIIQNYVSVADFDEDGDVDVLFGVIEAIENSLRVAIWDIQDPDDIRNAILTFGNTTLQAPAVGNITPHPGLEIAIESENAFYVLNQENLQPIWSRPLEPTGFSVDYCSLSDFNGDGYQEILFGSHQGMEIYNGDGETLAFRQANKQVGGQQVPLVADLNNDGTSEILYADNAGLAILRNPLSFIFTSTNGFNQPWAQCRSTWNQKFFYNTHINDNLTVPIQQQEAQLVMGHSAFDGFLQNISTPTNEVPDLSLKLLSMDCAERIDTLQNATHWVTMTAEICNVGAVTTENLNLPYLMTARAATENANFPNSADNILMPFNNDPIDYTIDGLNLRRNECQEVQIRHPYFFNPIELAQAQWVDTIWVAINLGNNYLGFIEDLDHDFYPSYLAECNYDNNRDFVVTSLANWHIENTEIDICDNETITLNAPTGYESYEWQDGSTHPNFTIQRAGKYWVTMVDGCGKVAVDTFTVTTALEQALQLPDTIFICRDRPVTIDIPYFQRAQWFPNVDCENCVDFEFTPTENQTYEVLANDENGCYSLDTVHIEIIEPLVQTLDTSVCKNAIFTFDDTEIPAASSRTFTYLDQYGCDSIWVVNVAESDATAYYLERDTAICENDFLIFENQTFAPDTTVVLQLQTFDGCDSIITLTINELATFNTNEERTICAGDSSLIFDKFATETGIFTNTFSAQNGCDSTHTVTLNVLSELTAETLLSPTCEHVAAGEIAVQVSGGLPPYQYVWSDELPSQATQTELTAGDYQLTITDDFGCQLTFDFSIAEPPAVDFILTTIPTSCFGANDGQLIVENATPDFRFQINHGNLLTIHQLDNLAAGTYDLTIFTENNCPYERTFSIAEPDELVLQITADTLINLGDTIVLNSQLNRVQAFDYQWLPIEGLSCANCPNPVAQPIETTTYELRVSNESSCSVSAAVTVEVDEAEHLYLPTAFSPNFDGINDYYTVFGGTDIAKITSLQIFDRWGGEVFDSESSGTLRWDGRRNNEFVPTGIYVVQVIAERVNGERIVRSQNVTIVR